MKRIILIGILLLIIIFGIILYFSPTLRKVIYYNESEIDDWKLFPCRHLKAAKESFTFIKPDSFSSEIATVNYKNQKDVKLEELLERTKTIAFIVVKNDTIMYEKYFDGYSDSTISYSFSMAKSFLSLLIGIALEEGLITSIEQPVTDYVPELRNNGFERVTIKHLLQMTGGLRYKEPDINPFGLHSHFYYGDDLEEKCVELKLQGEPGTAFSYKSGETQLLGLILDRALGDRTITDYMQEKLWTPLGMEYNALWSIDNAPDGIEKTFCCIAACARDFAKIGRLCLNNGNWNGKQLVPEQWIRESTKIDTIDGSVWYYQYQWWLADKEGNDYFASGHRGQYLYVNPEENVVIVRLGEKRALQTKDWVEIFRDIARKLNK